MKVGIYTRWQRRDSTYAAIQIADLMSLWQHEVTILTPTPKRPTVSNFWDSRVRQDSNIRFTDWAAQLAVVIWTFWPTPGQLEWTLQNNRRAILVPDWVDLRAFDDVGFLFDRIMAPTRRGARLLQGLGASNVVVCPWSPMLPITLRSLTEPVRVYVPPADRPGDVNDTLAIDIIEAMFELDKTVQATISLDGHRGAVIKRLERMAKVRSRLTLIRPEDYHRQLLQYSEHSLTLLTAVVEGFGMSALCSLHMGTPIIGFDAPPLDEITNPGNSVLIECGADRLDLLEALMILIQEPGLSRLFAGCPAGLERRRSEFEAAWIRALTGKT